METLERYLTVHLSSPGLKQIEVQKFTKEDTVRRLIQENEPLTEIVNEGYHGAVYKLTRDYVVKVRFIDCCGGRDVDYEYNIAKELYEADISVPEPIDIFDVETRNCDRVMEQKGFVMEFVREDAPPDGKFYELNQRLDQELDKCRKLGFEPVDIYWIFDCRQGHNVSYDKLRDKIYLFDFSLWERK